MNIVRSKIQEMYHKNRIRANGNTPQNSGHKLGICVIGCDIDVHNRCWKRFKTLEFVELSDGLREKKKLLNFNVM